MIAYLDAWSLFSHDNTFVSPMAMNVRASIHTP